MSRPTPGHAHRPGELLVAEVDLPAHAALLAGAGFRRHDRHGPFLRYVGPVSAPVPELVARSGGALEPNRVYRPDNTRGVRAAGNTRGVSNTRGVRAAPVGGVGRAVPSATVLSPLGAADGPRIGLVDTGVVVQGGSPHPWFGDHLDYEPFEDVDPLDTDHDGLLDPADGHGTFVAGVILDQAPTAVVRSMRVFDDQFGDDTEIAAALRLLGTEPDIHLINLSFGGVPREDSPPRVIQHALRLLSPEVVVVCAAGNHGDTRRHWPAAFAPPAAAPRDGNAGATVVAVGALGDDTVDAETHRWATVAPFSSHGDWITLYADGVDVPGPYCWFSETADAADAEDRDPLDYAGWAAWNGTSFAAAVVTGRIAAGMAGGTSAPAALRDLLAGTVQVDGLPKRACAVRRSDRSTPGVPPPWWRDA